ncbi:MAG: hypothetical protein OXI27_07375, partial [Thaumarchaeota archaeon]|nr:hypothetical protein [Nitrososphaerota archaeon]
HIFLILNEHISHAAWFTREEWAAERLRDAEKGGERPAEMWRWLLLDVHGAACNRSVRIPDRVEDHMCWNDSWLGDDGYAHTFNDYWLGGGYPKAPVRGGGIDPETGAYRIPLRHIRFFHGYPYVRGDAFEYPAFGQGFLVPTMLESMLDAEIIERRYRPRDRLAMGMGLGTKDPIAILGYLNDPNEASDVGGDGFLHTGTEVRILGRYGLVPGAGGRPGLGALPEKVTSECV